MLSRTRTTSEGRANVGDVGGGNGQVEVLHVSIERASALLPLVSGVEPDVFVTIRALPDESRHGRRTAIKLKTCDPVRAPEGNTARASAAAAALLVACGRRDWGVSLHTASRGTARHSPRCAADDAARRPQEWNESFTIPIRGGAVTSIELKGTPPSAARATTRHRALTPTLTPCARARTMPRAPPCPPCAALAVCHNERLGRTFLGVVVVPLPPSGDEAGVKAAFPLLGSSKHAPRLAAMASAAGVAAGSLGSLHLHMWRSVADATSVTPRRSAFLTRALTVRFAGGGGGNSGGGHGGGGADGRTPADRPPPLATGAPPRLDGFIHIDVVRARGLLPMDRVVGRDAATWTSDPFVTAQLVPAAANAASVATSVAKGMLCPTWDEELILAPTPGAHSVRLCVYDKDAVGTDDYMGEVMLALPPRPSAHASATPLPEHALLMQGWHPLVASGAEQREALVTTLRALGRHAAANALAAERRTGGGGVAAAAAAAVASAAAAEGAAPPAAPASDATGALGELYVRVSWGTGVRAADVNTRPALRPRIGTLRVRVHEARGLLPRFADRPLVSVRAEHQQGTTPAAVSTRDPVWHSGNDFTFVITEVTSDLVFTVLDRDPLLGDQVAGEVCVPLPLLLAPSMRAAASALPPPKTAARAAVALRRAAASAGLLPSSEEAAAAAAEAAELQADSDFAVEDVAPDEGPIRWAEILPRRQPGEHLQRLRPRPEKPLGALCYSARLTLDVSAAYAYACPDVMPPEALPGRDASGDFSIDALYISLGRMLDGIFMPLFAPCRTLLYLQSWQAPGLNAALIVALWVGTLHAWFLMRALTPLWIALWPVFNGFVSYRIHADDYVPLCAEEAEEEAKQRKAEAELVTRRAAMLYEACARHMAAAREAADPAAAAAAASAGVGLGGAISSTLTSVTSMFGSGDDSAQALSVYKRIKGKLEYAHVCGLYYADMLETWCGLFTWQDRSLSAVVAVAFTALGLAASVVLTSACLLGAALGLGVRHLVLVAGLACFYPSPAATRAYLEFWDYYLSCVTRACVACGTPPPRAADACVRVRALRQVHSRHALQPVRRRWPDRHRARGAPRAAVRGGTARARGGGGGGEGDGRHGSGGGCAPGTRAPAPRAAKHDGCGLFLPRLAAAPHRARAHRAARDAHAHGGALHVRVTARAQLDGLRHSERQGWRRRRRRLRRHAAAVAQRRRQRWRWPAVAPAQRGPLPRRVRAGGAAPRHAAQQRRRRRCVLRVLLACHGRLRAAAQRAAVAAAVRAGVA
jgi:hypothetical protein